MIRFERDFTVELLFTDGPFDPLPVDPATSSQYQSEQQYQQMPSYQTGLAPQTSQPFTGEYQSATRDFQSTESFIDPQTTTSNVNPIPSSSSTMSWYQPSMNTSSTMMPPPPINRETKENRQMLNQASDAVARATERLMTMGSMQKNEIDQYTNQVPPQKTQL